MGMNRLVVCMMLVSFSMYSLLVDIRIVVNIMLNIV